MVKQFVCYDGIVYEKESRRRKSEARRMKKRLNGLAEEARNRKMHARIKKDGSGIYLSNGWKEVFFSIRNIPAIKKAIARGPLYL